MSKKSEKIHKHSFKIHKAPKYVVLCITEDGRFNPDKTILSSMYYANKYGLTHDAVDDIIESSDLLVKQVKSVPHGFTYYKNGVESGYGIRNLYIIHGVLCLHFLMLLIRHFMDKDLVDEDKLNQIMHEASWLFQSIDEKKYKDLKDNLRKKSELFRYMDKQIITIFDPKYRDEIIDALLKEGNSNDNARFMVSN